MTTIKTDVKTIDIIALEWFDKAAGNSYFAGKVTVNYGMEDEREYKMPFQYGYDNTYIHEAASILRENGELPDMKQYGNGSFEALWQVAERNGIVCRFTKHENCKKRELKDI